MDPQTPLSILLLIYQLGLPPVRHTLSLLIPKPKLMPRSQPISSYPLYSSLMFHHSQVPCPAMISIIPPCSAETLTISRKPSIISKDGNEVAPLYLLAPCTLVTRSQVYWRDHSPSTVSIQFLPLLLTCPCFNTPDPHHPRLLDPRSCDLSSSDYCSSVISLV